MSIFYDNYNNEVKKFYHNNNIQVVCNGHRDSKDFLSNLYFNLSIHKNVVLTELGSTLFYSLFLKKNTFLTIKYKNKYLSKIKQTEVIVSQYKNYLKRNKFLLSRKIDLKKGYALAKQELGYNYIKKPKQLIKILDLNNYFKNIIKYFLSMLLRLRSF